MNEQPKDVSIRLKGEYRKHLIAIEHDWPATQADILGAALLAFRETPFEQQADLLRRVHADGRSAELTPAA